MKSSKIKGPKQSLTPKKRNFIRNIPEIFNHLLQSPCILSGQYRFVLFMQEACHQTTDEKNAISVSIIKGGVFGIAQDRSE